MRDKHIKADEVCAGRVAPPGPWMIAARIVDRRIQQVFDVLLRAHYAVYTSASSRVFRTLTLPELIKRKSR